MTSRASTDMNLLLGLLGIQRRLLDWSDLISALDAWIDDRRRSFPEILQQQSGLSNSVRESLEAGLAEHLTEHRNNLPNALAAISPSPLAQRDLKHVGDLCQNDLEPAPTTISSGSAAPETPGPASTIQEVKESRTPTLAHDRGAGPRDTEGPDRASEALSTALGSADSPSPDAGPDDRTITLSVARSAGADTVGFTPLAGATAHAGGNRDPAVDQTIGLEAARSQLEAARNRNRKRGERFEVLRPHARGGLGEVFLAHDRELNREVALKEIQDRYSDRPESQARFLIEAEITGSLEHPGIVPVYSLSQDAGGRPFYTMRFIRGEGLDQVIKQFHASGGLDSGEHSLEFRQLLNRFVDVCNTIAFAHSRQVLHRDLKPANVMLGPFGETLVVDWGLAKRQGGNESPRTQGAMTISSGSQQTSSVTLQGSAMGTPSYMSPEQSLGRWDVLGPASDVYSLGATLYMLLTGKEPFQADTVKEVLALVQKGEFPRPRSIHRGVPPALEAVCLKAMSLDADNRYASAQLLADDVEHFLADEPISAYREPWRARLARWARRHRTWTQAAAAALVAIAMVAIFSAVVVNAAREREHAARLREREQRLLTEKLNKERRERLQSIRQEGEGLFSMGQDALKQEDWRTARLELAKILAMTRPEAELNDLTLRADRLLAETESQLASQEATRKARDTYEKFQARRDDALYHGTLFTGMDLEANVLATSAAAREALALYSMADESSKTPILPSSSLTAIEREEIKSGCYELLLLLADAESTPFPKNDLAGRRNRANRALRILDRATALGVPTRSFHTRRAKYLEVVGDPRGALEETRHANTIEPTAAVDFFLLGEQLYKQRAWNEASRSFESALRVRPDYFWAQYFLAACHLKADPARPAEAKAHLTASLFRRPAFAWIYLLRGYAHGELGEFVEAEADFERALALGPDQDVLYGVLVNRGAMRLHQGNSSAAVADLTEAVQKKPNQDQAHANLALAYGSQKEWNKAIEQLTIAIRLAPQRGSLYRNRALLNLGRADTDAAFRDFGEAIRLAEGPTRLLSGDHVQRGRIMHSRKKWSEALAEYDIALKREPDDRDVERLRADALLALGRGSEAIHAFNHYLDPKNVDADAFRQRGFERARLSDFAGAIADFSQALDLDPASAFTRARRGWSLLNEASKLALRDFEEALKLEPRNGDLVSGRGYARSLLGNYGAAVADAEESLRLGIPGNELRGRLALTYNAACIYAQAAARAAFTAAGDAERQSLSRRYQDRAVELIRLALDLLPATARTGFIKQADADAILDPIRTYPPFVKLVAELTHSKANPNDSPGPTR